jgi:hypothetical protein
MNKQGNLHRILLKKQLGFHDGPNTQPTQVTPKGSYVIFSDVIPFALKLCVV